MLAYKGFNADLTCTMGKGRFKYEPGRWYSEDDAKCAETGFHATDNPLDVLSYYDKEDDRYFIVCLDGNIDEDGINSRISAPRIKLVKELTKQDLYHEGVIWMSAHPMAPLARVVRRDSGEAGGEGAVIVRGKRPKAKGEIGDRLYMVKEDKRGQIIEIGFYQVDGKNILPDIWYNERGERIDKKRTRKAKSA